MHYFLYPTKDAYISNDPAYMYKNTGLDEILEVEKRISYQSCASEGSYIVQVGYTSSSIELLSGSMSASYNSGSIDPKIVSSSYVYIPTPSAGAVLSRALLQFDLSEISASLSSTDLYKPTSPRFYLVLKVCESVEVPIKYSLAAYPISQSWNMGTGYKYDGAVADGVTWKFVDGVSKNWVSGSLVDCTGGGLWWVSSSLLGSGSGYVQPSYENWYDPSTPLVISGGYGSGQTFDYQSGDVRMEVTNMVYAWLSGSIANNGLILMHGDESSSIDYGTLKFFSKETNTIYSPYLDMCWNDSVFQTGSADPIQIRDGVVNMKNMAEEYRFGSIVRMDITARKRYPVKTFTNKNSDYLTPYYLPSSSYYQIKDAESEDTVIPYDTFTRLSFDGSGNYFMLDTSGLPQERYFKVEIRTEQSGSILTYTVPTAFKISR
jgi:hypothetical protein